MVYKIDFGSWDSNINPRIQKRLPGTHYGFIHLLDVPDVECSNNMHFILTSHLPYDDERKI
jgi:hypothetical protein